MCPGDKALMETAGRRCSGVGCCIIDKFPEYMRGFQFTLSRRDGFVARSDEEPSTVKVFIAQFYGFQTSDLYSSRINGSIQTLLGIFATDQPSCEIAAANKETYACSSGSFCETVNLGGYYCYCNNNPTSVHNAYILDGCIEGSWPQPSVMTHY